MARYQPAVLLLSMFTATHTAVAATAASTAAKTISVSRRHRMIPIPPVIPQYNRKAVYAAAQ